jgi:hypothetical protein
MNAITKRPESHVAATLTDRKLIRNAWDSATNLRDAIYALRLIVTRTWDTPLEADGARNAIDWISQKMDEESDAMHSAFEDLKPWETQP